jgi:cytidine deaminase
MGGGGAVMEDSVTLVKRARAAMANAYAPYSGFAVGAAVQLMDGTIVTGANVENASYGLSLCAETVAVAAAAAQGWFGDIEAIAVIGGGDEPVTPCGRCRQIIHEAEQLGGRPIRIICAGTEDHAFREHASIAKLLPHAFGPVALPLTPRSQKGS